MKPYPQRCTEGAARNDAWRKLTPKQQLAELDRRLGVGVGAQRQRARLAVEIEARSNPIIAGPGATPKKNKKAA